MVQLSIIAVVLTSALSSLVAANSCKSGGIYCGYGLMARGNYITKIDTNLAAKRVDQTDYNQKNSLWICSDHGDIEFKQLCIAGCVENGKQDDSCAENEAAEAAADAAEEAALAARKREIGKVWVA